jgi:hypothetical protein
MQKSLIRSRFLALLLSAAESCALPPCPGSSKCAWTNCEGTYTWSTWESHVGEWKYGKRLRSLGVFKLQPLCI